MESFKFYEVGGKIRDELLGLKSKDVDYVAVPSNELLNEYECRYEFGDDRFTSSSYKVIDMFNELKQYLEREKFEIFLVTPECYTIRAKFPNKCEECSGKNKRVLCAEHNCQNYSNKWENYSGVADFVMARKEVGYIPGTRTPIVKPGNLYDDLSRRDFTVNAMAKDPDTGEIIDYFDGMEDLECRVLRTPRLPVITFDDDPLRILRGIRFAITKHLELGGIRREAMADYDYANKMSVVSEERVREELIKCFKCNTILTLWYLNQLPSLKDYIFTHTKLWLKPTSEQ